mmetsp:Transcript_33408/g.84616  ORF Transcript_33408/g.84616 Transcript_33408/m.84616 type:complete len:205 (+) Transcript_33408:1787-2401(+)
MDHPRPPSLLQIVLQLHTQRTVVEESAVATVDLAALENEASPLAQTNQIFQGDLVFELLLRGRRLVHSGHLPCGSDPPSARGSADTGEAHLARGPPPHGGRGGGGGGSGGRKRGHGHACCRPTRQTPHRPPRALRLQLCAGFGGRGTHERAGEAPAGRRDQRHSSASTHCSGGRRAPSERPTPSAHCKASKLSGQEASREIQTT